LSEGHLFHAFKENTVVINVRTVALKSIKANLGLISMPQFTIFSSIKLESTLSFKLVLSSRWLNGGEEEVAKDYLEIT